MDKGLGDTIERITTATGIKKAVDMIAKKQANHVAVVRDVII